MQYTNETKGKQKVYTSASEFELLDPGQSCECESDEPRVLDVEPEPEPEPTPDTAQ